MKNKYQRLSKEEKKIAAKEFNNTEKGKALYSYIIRNRIMCIFGIVWGLAVYLYDILNGKTVVYEYVIYGLLLIVCTFLIIKSDKLYKSSINEYLIEKK